MQSELPATKRFPGVFLFLHDDKLDRRQVTGALE